MAKGRQTAPQDPNPFCGKHVGFHFVKSNLEDLCNFLSKLWGVKWATLRGVWITVDWKQHVLIAFVLPHERSR